MKWMRNCFCLSVAFFASMAAISTVALADGPDTMSQDPNQWVIAAGKLQRDPPQQTEPDQRRITPQN